jgi:hypothetical protein
VKFKVVNDRIPNSQHDFALMVKVQDDRIGSRNATAMELGLCL